MSDSERQNTTVSMEAHLLKPYFQSETNQNSKCSVVYAKEINITHHDVLRKNVLLGCLLGCLEHAFLSGASLTFQQIWIESPWYYPHFKSSLRLKRSNYENIPGAAYWVKECLQNYCSVPWCLDKYKPHIIPGDNRSLDDRGILDIKRLLEFGETEGSHDGETLAILAENVLVQLSLDAKFISITGDTTNNNETMTTEFMILCWAG